MDTRQRAPLALIDYEDRRKLPNDSDLGLRYRQSPIN